MQIEAERYHDFSCGHRVHGHESKCAHMHGHNYRVHLTVVQEDAIGRGQTLDDVGRVLDFSVIKSHVCEWIESAWDHKFLAWNQDPIMLELMQRPGSDALTGMLQHSVVWVPFNPTAENMAAFLVVEKGPLLLKGTRCRLVRCRIEETRKCSATYSL